MEYSDINNCLQILLEKPKWFFQKENVPAKLQCFDIIKKAGKPGTIYSLIHFLRSDNLQIRAKASETILILFAKLKSLNEYTDALKYLTITKRDLEYYRVTFDENIYLQLLGIASLNSNGYVREKAINELARLRNANGLKFILMRQGDWVLAVRNAATAGTLSFLENKYIEELIKLLPTIDWLLSVERVDLSEIHDKVIRFIRSQQYSEEFHKIIKRRDENTRFLFYKIYLTDRNLNREEILKVSTDKNILVRLVVLNNSSKLDPDTQNILVTRFLRDPSERVRMAALHKSKSLNYSFNNQITELLSDETTMIRQFCRHLLKDEGVDFAVLYRKRIEEKQLLSGSLLGLYETGSVEDLPIFEQNILVKSNKVIVACLTAINKFNEEKAKQYSLGLIVHSSTKVRDKAVEILAKNYDAATIQEINDIYANGNIAIKKTILKLYNRIGGWSILGDLLLTIVEENVYIQDQGWLLLEKWKAKSTRLFTKPPAAVVERANKIYNNLNPANLKLTPARISLLQEVRFILR